MYSLSKLGFGEIRWVRALEMRVRGVWKLGGNLVDEAGAGVVAS